MIIIKNSTRFDDFCKVDMLLLFIIVTLIYCFTRPDRRPIARCYECTILYIGQVHNYKLRVHVKVALEKLFSPTFQAEISLRSKAKTLVRRAFSRKRYGVNITCLYCVCAIGECFCSRQCSIIIVIGTKFETNEQDSKREKRTYRTR